MSRLKYQSLFPSAYTWQNLKLLLLLLVPGSILLQIPIILFFTKCVDQAGGHSGKVCAIDYGPVFMLGTFMLPLAAIIALKYWRKLRWAKFGLVKTDLRLTLRLLALGAVLITALNISLGVLAARWPIFGQSQFEFSGTPDLLGFITFFAATSIFAPLTEELLFRGFTFSLVGRRWGVILGILISSLSFGLAHLQPNIVLVTAILGVYLCWMYLKTKSLVPGIVLHMLNNATAVTILLLNR
jgi:membrane protease YdiL (CAAX protease family)